MYREMLGFAREAERLEFDSVWCAEHHFLDDSYLPSPLVFCAAMAAQTERLRVGTSILQAPLHNVLRLAEDAAVVDLLSNGRLTLGLGQGWRAEEFAALGIPLRGRHQLFEAQVLALREAWSDKTVSAAGESEVWVTPKPRRANGVPLYIGASAEAAVRRAGRLGDGLISSGLGVNEALGMGPALSPQTYAQTVRWIEEELEAAGRDRDDFTLCVSLPTLVFDDDAVWQRAREHHWYVGWQYPQVATQRGRRHGASPPPITSQADAELRRTAMLGPADVIIERIRAFAELTACRFEFHARMIAPGVPADVLHESLQRFATEVVPAFR